MIMVRFMMVMNVISYTTNNHNTFKNGKSQTHQIARASSNVAFGHDRPKDGDARTYTLDSVFYLHPLHLCEMCTR